MNVLKKILPFLIVALSLIGMVDASYITWEKLSGQVPPCSGYFKCGDVLNSPWSSIGPIPLSLFGLLFYTVFFITSCGYVLGWERVNWRKLSLPLTSFFIVWGICGTLFSLYLVGIMGLILQAWCLYCLISAVTCCCLGVSSVILYLLSGRDFIGTLSD